MTKNYLRPPTAHQFVRCFRAPAGFAFGMFAAASVIAQCATAVGSARLRRSGMSTRGSVVKSSSRSGIAVVLLVIVGAVGLVAMLVVRWQRPEDHSGTAGSAVTTIPAPVPQQLEAWRRPTTSDPRAFAIAYARTIWTYDTTRHSYVDWQNAVSVYADPTSAAPEVAKSLLPQWAEWDQLQLHKAHATAAGITAKVTPELEAMVNRSQAPDGWHAYVIQGKQAVVLDTGTRILDRQAAVAVVCTPTCKFWSATSQVSP
jgi:hypothetical protein